MKTQIFYHTAGSFFLSGNDLTVTCFYQMSGEFWTNQTLSGANEHHNEKAICTRQNSTTIWCGPIGARGIACWSLLENAIQSGSIMTKCLSSTTLSAVDFQMIFLKMLLDLFVLVMKVLFFFVVWCVHWSDRQITSNCSYSCRLERTLSCDDFLAEKW